MKVFIVLIVVIALFGFGMLGHAIYTLLAPQPDTDISHVMTVVYEDDTLLCYRLSAGYTNNVWYNGYQQCLVKR